MRRKIAFVICVVLILSAVAGLFSSSQAAADYSYVRVKLSIGTPKSFSFLADGNYSVSGKPLERQLYTVRIDGSQLKLCLGETVVAQGSTIYITRHQGTPGRNNVIWLRNSQYDYRQYLGDMSFSIQNGAIQLVNRIPMEEYLYGVVPHEMSDSFPLEALKSQAVAARNYAARAISSSGTYDLTDLSSVDQVYKGYDASTTNAIAAVNATAGQVMTYGGKIIDAYYSASNGGMTDLPYHRWGGGADWRYYDIQPDPYDIANPSSLYETIFFPSVIDANHPVTSSGNAGKPNTALAVNYIKTAILNSGQLAAYGVTNISQFDLSGVISLEAHTYESPASTNGRSSQDHSRMPITGVNNCIDKVRARGSFIVTVYPVSATSANIDTAVTQEPAVNEAPAVSEEPAAAAELTAAEEMAVAEDPDAGEEPSVRDEPAAAEEPAAGEEPSEAVPGPQGQKTVVADAAPAAAGTVVTVSNIDFNLRHLNGSDGDSTWKAFQSTSLSVLLVEPVYSNGTLAGYNISQRRYGHGCGLSQRGAQQRAKDSDPNVNTYDKILAFYYPGTTLTTLNTSASLPAPLSYKDYTNGKVINVTTSVNVRSGPSTSYTLLGTVPLGARLELKKAEVESNWYMFNYGGTTAYIHKSYVQQDTSTLLSTQFIRSRDNIYITAGTTCSMLLGSFKGYSGTVTIRDASGTVISGNAQVTAGSTVTLTDGSGNVLDRVTARVLKGDVNGDGQINVSDYTQIRLHILRLITLDSYGAQMADMNGDGKVDISDYTLLRLYLLGLWDVN